MAEGPNEDAHTPYTCVQALLHRAVHARCTTRCSTSHVCNATDSEQQSGTFPDETLHQSAPCDLHAARQVPGHHLAARPPTRAPAKPAPAPQARQPRDEQKDGTGRDGTGRRGAGGERTPPRPSRGSAAGGAGRARSTQLTSLGEEAAACTEATYLSTSGFVRRNMAPSPAVRPALVVTDLWPPASPGERGSGGRPAPARYTSSRSTHAATPSNRRSRRRATSQPGVGRRTRTRTHAPNVRARAVRAAGARLVVVAAGG